MNTNHHKPQSKIITFLVGILVAFSLGLAHSAPIPELYEAKMPVIDKSEQERNKALRAALRQVIIKITGRREAVGRSAIAKALEQPDRYIQQFLYQTEKTPSESAELVFWAKFDPGAVSELLRSANLPSWERARPSMLIWLVVKGDKESVLLSTNSHGELSSALRQGAAERGVSIMLPLLDLRDSARIGATDVWNRSRQRILDASERYVPDTILVGRVYSASATGWKAHWELLGAGARLGGWTTYAGEPGGALRKGVHGAADILVNRYAGWGRGVPTDAALTRAQPTVSGIDTIADYARTLRYLEGLQSEAKVYVTRASGNRISFLLSVPGGEAEFARIAKRGTTLAETSSTDGAFIFRLLP
uniref:DUF2066 domain-containing protein n=1 Tax=Candidatus Kentrum sp. FM TaxID=2126340 RepID=A0A450WY60_9GAMM|nr:MAG: hypothetical protein BECKFM1743C_GA0114222_101165 [Candidatus Kentron sp. FM]VFJ74568.1 MAG: hypothetical protein BECKFM1743A_GA0114220_107861 [Candidatus Kentron sp. FM]VFK21956.1 MAG: hypothetical protein BECKFM1743B_GA0114221_108292 [Candidatus Kentron sp. FM]